MSVSLVDEVYVAVIGYTGSGKTSLIKALEGQIYKRSKESPALDPDTKTVQCTWIQWPKGGVKFAFLDTPGLNGDKPNEVAVLRQVRSWMEEHTKYSKVAGILYLSSILSRRPTELKVKDTMKNETTYISLCGEDPFTTVYLTTTFWDELASQKYEKLPEERQMELENTVWKPIIEKGGHMMRYERDTNNLSSTAWSALDDFLYASLVRQAREEARNLRTKFRDQSGRQLLDDWERIIDRQRELKAKKASDSEFQSIESELRATVEEIRARQEVPHDDHTMERLSKLSVGIAKNWITTGTNFFRRKHKSK